MKNVDFWITEHTKIPGDIYDALAEDKLVLFVGAGASMASPSSLPSFHDLVKKLCIKTGHTAKFLTPNERYLNKKAKLLGLDAVLGEISDSMGSVGNTLHEEIKSILSEAFDNDRINDTHSAVVNLAKTTPTFRVVTTNQDRLLEHSGKLYNPNENFSVFDAPALPDGTDFEGIVNLHGSIRDPKRMIFTDRNFGEAYLTKQYCARFLTELFSKFTILFVGYSHDDPLMKYHARGLSDCKRFILTNDTDNEKWKLLGIETIAYPSREGTDKHSEVPQILNKLSERGKQNLGDTRRQIAGIAKAGPQDISKPDISLIRKIFLEDDSDAIELRNHFLGKANDVQWCAFFENDEELKAHNVLQNVFRNGNYDNRTEVISNWFLRVCFEAEEAKAHAYGFEKLSDSAAWHWNECFTGQVLQLIAKGAVPEKIIAKLSLLCAGMLRRCSDKENLVYCLTALEMRHHKTLVFAMLDILTEPILKIKRNLFSHAEAFLRGKEESDEFYIEPEISVNDMSTSWALREWWCKGTDYSSYYNELLDCFSHNMDKYYSYLNDSSSANSMDAYSCRIDDLYAEIISDDNEQYIVILMMRDILLNGSETLRRAFIDRYAQSNFSALIRLCIVAVTECSDMTDDEKILWLADNDILLPEARTLYADFEIHRLLRSSLQQASDVAKQRLLGYIRQKHGWIDLENIEHTWDQYRLCCWICDIRKDWSVSFCPLISKYKQDDGWAEVPLPQRRISESEWTPEVPSAMDADTFIKALKSEPTQAINDLFHTVDNYKENYGMDLSAGYNPYSQTIYEAVGKDASTAIKIWDLDFDRTVAKRFENEIKTLILYVLGRKCDNRIFVKMLPRLRAFIDSSETKEKYADQVLHYLSSFNADEESIGPEIIPDVAAICNAIWERYNANFENSSSGKDLPRPVFNAWPCSMVTVLLNLLKLHNKKSEHQSIPDSVKRIFDTVLEIENRAAQCAILRMFRSFQFVYLCDEEYGTEKLMPVINSSVQKESKAWFAWLGFCYNPRFDNRMLGKGLFDAICTLQPEVFKPFQDGEIYTCFFQIAAEVLSYANVDVKARRTLLNSIARDSQSSSELLQCAYYAYFIQDKSDSDVIWSKWVEEYIFDRLANRPVQLTDGEFWMIYNFAFVSGEHIDQVADAILKSERKLNFKIQEPHRFFLHKSPLDRLILQNPETLVTLVSYLLLNSEGGIDVSSRRQIRGIREKVPEQYKMKLDEACSRSGIDLLSI